MSGESFVGEANTHIDLWVFRKLVEKKKRKESKYMFFQEYVKSVGNMSVRQDILEEAEKIMGIKINLDTKVDRSFIGNVHSPLDCWEEIVSNRGISDFSFRWGFFNHYFPSIIKSEVMVVGGYSGTGKTMMAGNMATDAIKGGKKVLIFSMEMKKGALLKRMIADGIDTPYRELGQHLQESKDYLHQINEGLRIIDENNLSIEQICGYIEATITSGFTPDIIIFDYLQYIKGCSEFAVVAESAKAMKAIAKKYNVFVVCLSQLNRGFFGSKKVHIGLLKGAGDIEASADYIILITNEEEGSPNVTATIGKNRNGAKGASIPMIFDTEMMRFE
jgi:KaiC/GvpD/RAD55 family RecA-like ATPase